MRFRVAGLISLALGVSVSVAGAQSVATRGALNGILSTSTLETYAAFAVPFGTESTVPGPVTNNAADARFVAGVTYSSLGPPSVYGTNFFVPGPGWVGYANEAFLAGTNTLRITFDVFTQAFGLDVSQFDCCGQTESYAIYSGTTLLGSGSIFAPNAPSSSFLGWQNAGGISYVELTSTYDWSPIVDNVQFGTTAPEPASIALMATGLLSLGGVQLRRRKKTTA